MNKITVVIRNKNQSVALEFLLKDLTERYLRDVDEIIAVKFPDKGLGRAINDRLKRAAATDFPSL